MSDRLPYAAHSKRREAVLAFIKAFHATNGYSPSYRDIAIGIGVNSKSAVKAHVDALVREGKIRRLPNSPRAISVVTQ